MTTVSFFGKTVGEILKEESLHIPIYQRPYKWKTKHIRQLFYDIKDIVAGGKQKDYQIGLLILHSHDDKLDVVDGQQRLISVALLLQLMGKLDNYQGAKALLHQEFGNISQKHAKENYQEWCYLKEASGQRVTEAICDFLLNQCSLSVILLPEEALSEAFQLFDSQNSRGKCLEPHDLLKAYHLRNIKDTDEATISYWEEIIDDDLLDLKSLFNNHLFRLRRWVNGDTGLIKKRYASYLRFTEAFVDDFKGVDLSKENYPYLRLYHLLAEQAIVFPYSLTMPIMNGKEFFAYIEASHKLFKDLLTQVEALGTSSVHDKEEIFSIKVRQLLARKEGKFQKNRNLLLNIIALFNDRFGEAFLSQDVIEILVIWAYYPRTVMSRMMDATLAKYAAGGELSRGRQAQKMFQLLNHSLTPSDFLAGIDRNLLNNMSLDDILREIDK